jgi:hypothetical protein
MANGVIFLDHGTVFPIKVVDNGDGTYSLATSGGGGVVTVTGSIGGAVIVTSGNVNVSGTVGIQGVVPTYDAGPYWTSAFGVTGSAAVLANITGTPTPITDVPTSGQKLVVTDVLLSVDTAMNILLQEETSGNTYVKIFLPANGTVQWTPRSKVKLATANKRLTAKASVGGNVAITTNYYSES